jgi:hypothetical protein
MCPSLARLLSLFWCACARPRHVCRCMLFASGLPRASPSERLSRLYAGLCLLIATRPAHRADRRCVPPARLGGAQGTDCLRTTVQMGADGAILLGAPSTHVGATRSSGATLRSLQRLEGGAGGGPSLSVPDLRANQGPSRARTPPQGCAAARQLTDCPWRAVFPLSQRLCAAASKRPACGLAAVES